jgi:hypothetical protein
VINEVSVGDARRLVKRIPDASVDLIYTDPIYANIRDYAWLSRQAMRILKDNSACVVFYATKYLPETIRAMQRGGLTYRWQMFGYITNEMKPRPGATGKCVHVGLLWFEKGKSRHYGTQLDVRAVPTWTNTAHSNHPWSKHPLIVSYYLEGLSRPDDLVFHPFCGGGAIPRTARKFGRRYIAFERDKTVAMSAQASIEVEQVSAINIEQEAF